MGSLMFLAIMIRSFELEFSTSMHDSIRKRSEAELLGSLAAFTVLERQEGRSATRIPWERLQSLSTTLLRQAGIDAQVAVPDPTVQDAMIKAIPSSINGSKESCVRRR
jgi:hypothetical protein